MKKPSLLVAVSLVLLLSISVAAASLEFYGGGSYNNYNPGTLNDLIEGLDLEQAKMSFEEGGATADVTENPEKIKSGCGMFGGVRSWINPTTALGGEFDYFRSNSEGSMRFTDFPYGEPGNTADGSLDISIEASVMGFSGIGAFQASPAITVFASVGYYFLDGSIEMGLDTTPAEAKDEFPVPPLGKAKFDDSTLGFKAGAAFSYPVADELSILGRAAFRSLNFKEVEFDDDAAWSVWADGKDKADLDFSGLELGLGIVYSF